MGIDKELSTRAQKLAAVPEDKFEGLIGEWRERVSAENERASTARLESGSPPTLTHQMRQHRGEASALENGFSTDRLAKRC